MIKKVRLFFTGIFINIQFLTTIPIRKNFPLSEKELTYALQTFPVLGLVQGIIYAAVLYSVQSFFPFSDLFNALVLWLLLIVLTGGIHLDGWIDTSDAYFSYQEPEKRLEVMNDPRVGAFGVLSVVVFLFVRFIILYESIRIANDTIYLVIILIPFLGKMLTASLLQGLPLAKKDGMAHFLRQGRTKYYPLYQLLYLLLIGGGVYYFMSEVLLYYFIFIILTLLLGLWMGVGIKRNFNGISGDTLGASTEGMELILWMAGLLLHFFAME